MPHPAPISLSALALLALAASPGAQEASPTGEPPGPPVEEFVVDVPEKGMRLKVRHTTIGYQDPTVDRKNILISPDGRHMAYMVISGGTVHVVEDGVDGPTFEGISPENIFYSAQGGTLGYYGVRGKRSYAVVKGKEHEFHRLATSGVNFSLDGSSYGFVGKRGKRWHAVINGEESLPYHHVSRQGIAFSDDGEHSAFIASLGPTKTVVLDLEPGPEFDDITQARFNARGQLSYVAKRGDDWIPVIQQRELGAYDAVKEYFLTFARDASRWGLLVSKDDKWHALIDGELGPAHFNVAGLSISNDGSHVAYLATDGKNTGWYLVLDGDRQDEKPETLNFSPDGKRIGQIFKRDGGFVARVDGTDGERYDRILPPGIVFSEDGAGTLYRALRGTTEVLVIDGKEEPALGELGRTAPAFLPATSKTVYSKKVPGGEMLVIDRKPTTPYRAVRYEASSPGGGRFAFAGAKGEGRWVCVADGAEARLADGTVGEHYMVRQPVFSPDGKRLAYVSWNKKGDRITASTVVDGVPHPAFDDILFKTLSFTPSGEHVVYCAGTGAKRYIVVDGHPIDGGYTGFLWSLDVGSLGPNRFHLLANASGRYVLVDVEILDV